MKKELYRLSKNDRVRRILEKGTVAPVSVLSEENINPSQCVYCGADLPSDWDFQAFHMLKAHGLEV